MSYPEGIFRFVKLRREGEIFAKIEVAAPEEDVSSGEARSCAPEWRQGWYLWRIRRV